MYPNIHSRAGLVTLAFVFISISLVSAVPIPFNQAPQSGLSSTLLSPSNPSYNGQDHIQHRTANLKLPPNAQLTRAPAAARALIGKHNSIDMDDNQLVRRNIFTKIKQGFQKLGQDIKHVAQKVGSGIKSVAQKIGSGIKSVAQKVGSGIKSVAQKVGSGIKKVAQKVGSGIKRVAQKVGSGIKHVAQKVGAGIKIAAKKVGHFLKTTGAVIAKVGLKAVQAVGTAIGKVVSFIPDVGKPLQQVINGASRAAGAISDRIHAKLSGKEQKVLNGFNKADKIMSYIPRRRDLSEEEAFWRRDPYHLEELDDYGGSYFDDDYEHSGE